MTYIGGTQIRTVSGVSGDVFYYDNVYWRWYGGQWWRSTVWNRGWLVVNNVPQAFLRIPRTHRAYRVVHNHPSYRKPVKVKTSPPKVKRPGVRTPGVRRPGGRPPGAGRPVRGGHVKSAVKKALTPAPGRIKKPVKKKKGGKSAD